MVGNQLHVTLGVNVQQPRIEADLQFRISSIGTPGIDLEAADEMNFRQSSVLWGYRAIVLDKRLSYPLLSSCGPRKFLSGIKRST